MEWRMRILILISRILKKFVILSRRDCIHRAYEIEAFPFTLKDKAKLWFNSLRPQSIRYMEVINACPHHGFDTWMLVSYFYEGMSPTMKQLLETMCGEHEVSGCPTIPAMGERLVENHPSMSWNCGQEQFSSRQYSQSQQFMEDSPQQVSLVEQAIVNLSKILGDFIGDQKNINTQHSYGARKGKFSSQPQQNPSGVHEIGETSESSIEKDEVKAVITLRGGKQVDQPMPKPKENEGGKQKENVKEQEKGKK
ncbi:hypothetical protein CK203_036637 [Vitis vinifera]|uniref:Retrotransposon gag domain-containing protein n=1 Tax=Vitis vinifera TaxID=29760 RepID=A0A438HIK3_VITVI|nr:hypothetical protein CK203_036637 [Vitis vinifera]